MKCNELKKNIYALSSNRWNFAVKLSTVLEGPSVSSVRCEGVDKYCVALGSVLKTVAGSWFGTGTSGNENILMFVKFYHHNNQCHYHQTGARSEYSN